MSNPVMHDLPSLPRGRRMFRFTLLLVVLLGVFFVGRRVYYRLIQPPPAWLHETPRQEAVIAAAGLEVTLWADGQLIHNPTSLAVDQRGRVWVTEAVNYRDWQNHQSTTDALYRSGGDRVMILADTNGDGTADSASVFVEDPDLIAPTGICVAGNRVYVACSPSLLVYVDEDGDDQADRREEVLTGFGGKDHDHGIHGITLGPDGRLYFSVGNAGPHVITDRSGQTFRIGSVCQAITKETVDSDGSAVVNTGGMVSDDGHLYVGGFIGSILPDGSDLRICAHNCRNPYDVAVDSSGNLWQTDNDDSLGCRMTWVLPGANLGFTSADGNRTWQADQRPGQDIATAEWHQEDPGVLPAGLIYGTGAPTGLIRCEGNQLGKEWCGALLACDAGL
ncbi:MAG: PQQ-dependent sugar dehydrogenase, partial [Planctomycetaceae bacterium]|nr:PQQ-dependent sugar dehydrogenase [Planctomycetaceae bacterium]